jgi:hypothetical protein
MTSDDDATPCRPKYREPDFMLKQIALFYRARAELRAIRRYGDDDAPVPAIAPIAAIRSIHRIRGPRPVGDAGAASPPSLVPAVAAPLSAGRNLRLVRGAAFALGGADRAIALAVERGASPYLDAARAHYRNALARYRRQDPGAAGEAMAALALARAAAADHPLAAPRDRPPAPAAGASDLGFDAQRLADDVKAAGTPEAADLGQKAVVAGGASARAAAHGDRNEAMRQSRLAISLAMAVRSLAFAADPARERGGP